MRRRPLHRRCEFCGERDGTMCGIVGVVSNAPVNQLIYDALLLLQHSGQDAAGIVTQQDRKFFMHKAKGMVRDVFRTRNMRALPGSCGLGQVRYPTAGNAYSEEEAQPFYVNARRSASCWCTTAT
jgi:amidophosphoribosyltransferase